MRLCKYILFVCLFMSNKRQNFRKIINFRATVKSSYFEHERWCEVPINFILHKLAEGPALLVKK